MTQLPVPNVGMLMGAYGELGAQQGRNKKRQQNLDNALAIEDRMARQRAEQQRAAIEAARLQDSQQRQMRDTALSLARLYTDDSYRRAALQNRGDLVEQQYGMMAQRDASNVLNEQVNERLQFGANANLSEEARSAHQQQLGKLQAIMKARSRSTRPWQYDDALANWVREYDAMGIPAQVRPDPEPQMVPISTPDGQLIAMGLVDPSTGKVERTVPLQKSDTSQQLLPMPSNPYEAFYGGETAEERERAEKTRDKYRQEAIRQINLEHTGDGDADLSDTKIRAMMVKLWDADKADRQQLRNKYTSNTAPTTSAPQNPMPTTAAPPPPPAGQFTPQQAAVIEQAKQAAASGDQQAMEFLRARGLL